MDNGPTPFRVVWLTAYRYGNAAVIVVFGALRVKHRRIFATPWIMQQSRGTFHASVLQRAKKFRPRFFVEGGAENFLRAGMMCDTMEHESRRGSFEDFQE